MYKVKTNNKTSKKITNKVDFVNLDGFLMPSKKQYFIINSERIKDIKVVDNELIKAMVSKKVKAKYKRLIAKITELFLDEDGGCGIYNVRPIICRTHGICYYSDDAEHKICDKIPSYMNNKDNMLDIDEYKMEIASVGNYRKNGKGVALFRRKYPIFYFMKIYFENGRTVTDYFKHPVIHNILHGKEEMLYDCICNFNGIK